MDCMERNLLWEKYQQATELLFDCVDILTASSPSALGSGIISAKAAKDLCERAKKKWEEHLREHGCDSINGTPEAPRFTYS